MITKGKDALPRRRAFTVFRDSDPIVNWGGIWDGHRAAIYKEDLGHYDHGHISDPGGRVSATDHLDYVDVGYIPHMNGGGNNDVSVRLTKEHPTVSFRRKDIRETVTVRYDGKFEEGRENQRKSKETDGH